jgi:hypothetical protein
MGQILQGAEMSEHRFIADTFNEQTQKAEEKNCPEGTGCEGGGWECYGTGSGDPHFKVCEVCGNPEGVPCP